MTILLARFDDEPHAQAVITRLEGDANTETRLCDGRRDAGGALEVIGRQHKMRTFITRWLREAQEAGQTRADIPIEALAPIVI